MTLTISIAGGYPEGQKPPEILRLDLRPAGSGIFDGYVLATWKDAEFVVWRCWLVDGTLAVESGDYFGAYSGPNADAQAIACFYRRAGRPCL